MTRLLHALLLLSVLKEVLRTIVRACGVLRCCGDATPTMAWRLNVFHVMLCSVRVGFAGVYPFGREPLCVVGLGLRHVPVCLRVHV